MRETYNIRFDATGLFEHFGGVMATAKMLKEAGIDMKMKTLRKQKERDAVSSEMVASIVYAAAKTGTPINLEQFLLERN